MRLIPRIVISGLRGGSGKTILSLCLIASWRKKDLRITPFKKGPDYIDAGWLAKVAGTPCYNLDLFMMTSEQVVQSFISHANPLLPPFSKGGRGGIIAVIEGNRGLYDGVDHEGTYSSASLAKLLKSPVLLIVDCAKATNTIAALVLGCQKMDPDVSIGGVVLNQVATGRQESVIRKSINDTCNLPVLGAIPRLKHDPFPERHMGLTPFQEHSDIEKSLSAVAEIGEKYIDVDGVLKIAESAEAIMQNTPSLTLPPRGGGQRWGGKSEIKIGVIKDSAFQFYYPDNFEALEKRGAKLIEINALSEPGLPDIDALYIGGGFPETHAMALAENISFINSLREAVENGLPVYAECGGFMYLGENLVLDSRTYPMAGVFPVVFGLEKKPQAHGYTIIEIAKPNPYFSEHSTLKGHEFHYSRVLEMSKIPQIVKDNENPPFPPLIKGGEGGFGENIYFAFRMKRGQGITDKMDGLCYKNVLATYTHLHAIGAQEWADGLMRCAKEFQSKV